MTPANRRTLFATFIGWTFDGYETYALIVVVAAALKSVGTPTPNAPLWAGVVIGTTLLGWAVGGLLGGIVADRFGRKRAMIIAIIGYAVLTGLTALSPSFLVLVVLRFFTGIMLGSEWSTGTALIAETWPDEARAKAAGIMQSGFGVGSLIASLSWFLLSPVGPDAWRLVFLVGVLPAFFALYVRARIPESKQWQDAVAQSDGGAPSESTPAAGTRRPGPFAVLLRDPQSRRRALWMLIASLFSIGAWYAASTALPLFVTQLATAQGLSDVTRWTAIAGITYNVGAIAGYMAGGFIADQIGRRPYIAAFCVASVIMTGVLYFTTTSLPAIMVLAAVNGFFTLGIFAAFAIYLPELFPAGIRATAIGFVFNSNRLIACAGPVVFGGIVATLGGPAYAALIVGLAYLVPIVTLLAVPETKGRPLPA